MFYRIGMKMDISETYIYHISNELSKMYLSRIKALDGAEDWSISLFGVLGNLNYHYEDS